MSLEVEEPLNGYKFIIAQFQDLFLREHGSVRRIWRVTF